MKLTERHVGLILINVLVAICIVGALLDPLFAVAFVRVMVSMMPILLTIGSGLVFKWLFRL